MTEERKEELKCFIIYLDLTKMQKEEGLNDMGYLTLLDLQLNHPNFSDEKYRRTLATEIFNLIDNA